VAIPPKAELFNRVKIYGKEKETIYKASVWNMQKDKLFHSQIKISG